MYQREVMDEFFNRPEWMEIEIPLDTTSRNHKRNIMMGFYDLKNLDNQPKNLQEDVFFDPYNNTLFIISLLPTLGLCIITEGGAPFFLELQEFRELSQHFLYLGVL